GGPMESIFNVDKALKRTMGDEELLKELITFTVEDMDKLLQDVRRATQSGEAQELKNAAHKLKGSAGTVGADRLFYAAFNLEQQAAEGQTSRWSESLKELEKQVECWLNHEQVLQLQSN
nr:Hpt domain-containing protein [Spirochaetaceae bacterium]